MSRPRVDPDRAADALVGTAPLVSRWIERLIANHQPPLTLAQFVTLRAVAAGLGSGTQLARSAGVSGPAISQLIATLVDSGLLTRTQDADDRRRSALALTPSGECTLAAVNARLRASLGEVLAQLPRPEVDALTRALPHVQAVLSGVAPPRRPAPPRPPGRPGGPGPPLPPGIDERRR